LKQSGFLFESAALGEADAAAQAARLALPPRAGHYDELRDAAGNLRPHWAELFRHLGTGGLADLDRRAATVARQIRDDGVTYNVYGEEAGTQRPWSLDLLPFVFEAAEWAQLEAGISQRARLLSRTMHDIYGPQELLHDGLVPPALVLGNAGYLRPLAGCRPAGGTYLYIIAFDLARGPDGRWWVVGQRTQAPSGLGYALQNRMIVSHLFPEAFRELKVQRLASTYRHLLDYLTRLAPQGGGAGRIVLLTPGPYNETYFEHAYLARYLGIPLVEGGDLSVRDNQVFLKTLHGLERVHGILRRLDDDFCDPLELRADSTLGVPGLLRAVRAGQVLVANALGSGFLESPAINGFLPGMARRLLEADLLLPSLATWWCGEAAAWRQVRDSLHDKVIKPTYPPTRNRPSTDVVIGADLDAAQLDALRARIDADPEAFTVQAYVPLSQAPGWTEGGIAPRSAMVRLYAIGDVGGRWRVMPGGLTRIAGREMQMVSMQRGGSSQDAWVRTEGTVDAFSMLPTGLRPEDLAGKRRPVTSRAAENLFWMGRYTERTDFTVRLTRALLQLLGEDAQGTPRPLLVTCGLLAQQHGLVPAGTPSPEQSPQARMVFERTLLADLTDTELPGVAFNLAALAQTAGQVRERLSADHWRMVAGSGPAFAADCAQASADGSFSPDEASAALAQLAVTVSAITGAQTDRMTRDDGWRLLATGRQLERLVSLARVLHTTFEQQVVLTEEGFDLLLTLFDSAITYRSLYQRRQELPALLDLLVLDTDNPRSLACVTTRLCKEVRKLPGHAGAELAALLQDPQAWPALEELSARAAGAGHAALLGFAAHTAGSALALSDAIGARYFSHASDMYRPLPQ
jgi:uncharacterized circularly permuted ATP-grasp superfamily protein/uncharacterized alpha-E superfamily protein